MAVNALFALFELFCAAHFSESGKWCLLYLFQRRTGGRGFLYHIGLVLFRVFLVTVFVLDIASWVS